MASVLRSISYAGSAALEPYVVGPILAALLYAPASLRERVLATLGTSPRTLRSTLWLLLAGAVARSASRLLSSVAANNWRLSGQPGWDWPNEVAVVTGGCSGIGLGIAKGLAAKGVRVAVLDIQAPPPELTAVHGISYFQCDIASVESVAKASDAVRAALGSPSILVNNAGLSSNGRSILDTDQEVLDKIFRVNLLSYWSMVQQFLPAMVERNKGHVVTVASIQSFNGMSRSSTYSCTKAGALSFHEGLTQEIKHVYKAPSVITTIVHPFWVLTPMIADRADAAKKQYGKLLTVEEVVEPTIAQIFNRRGGQLILPGHLSWLSTVRGWPTWAAAGLWDIAAGGASKRA